MRVIDPARGCDPAAQAVLWQIQEWRLPDADLLAHAGHLALKSRNSRPNRNPRFDALLGSRFRLLLQPLDEHPRRVKRLLPMEFDFLQERGTFGGQRRQWEPAAS